MLSSYILNKFKPLKFKIISDYHEFTSSTTLGT